MTTNSPAPRPIESLDDQELLEDFLLFLRAIAVKQESYTTAIPLLKEMHAEIEKRGIVLKEPLSELTQATKWNMEDFLTQCLNYPKLSKKPVVRLLSTGLRKGMLCKKCNKFERIREQGFFCRACLLQAQDLLKENNDPSWEVFCTQNSSIRCVHATGETKLISYRSALGEDYDSRPYCKQCILIELSEPPD